jgi:protein tyrosine phosphatase (PTP) superfamily phosphohydrolase (DUF442 family)
MLKTVARTNAVPEVKRRSLARPLVLFLLPFTSLALWAGYVLGTDNFHTVVRGEAYRSGQMSSNELARCLKRYGIRSVINLRGENPKHAWYREELEAVRAAGVVHRDLALSSRRVVTRRQVGELVTLFKDLPKPVLIHCSGGADRVAFAAALYQAEVAGRPEKIAERQFSMWYGYLPFIWKEKERLRESFRAYTKSSSMSTAHETHIQAGSEL